MSRPSIQFHKIWIEQCAAAEDIGERFGREDAMRYLIGEKLFSFVRASEDDPDFATELPAFVAEIRRLFSTAEIRKFLDDLERTNFLVPPEADREPDGFDDDQDEELWLDNPVLAAEELLRFSRIRQLLQE